MKSCPAAQRFGFLLGLVVLVCGAGPATLRGQTTILAWDFTGITTAVATYAPTTTNANLDSVSSLTRGAGAAASLANNSFRTTGFQNNGISTANTDYFQFTLSPATGYTLSLSTLDYKVAGTATYVYASSTSVLTQFAYSLDGSNFTLIGSAASPYTSATTAVTTAPQINLSGISELQSLAASTTVTFRFYASGQTTTGGFGFSSSSSNGLALAGTLSLAGGANVSHGGGATFTSGSFGGAAFTSSDVAVFDGTATTVNLSGAVATSGLKFTTSGYTLASPTGSDTVSIAGGGVDVGTATTATVSAKITGSNVLTKSGAGTLVLSGTNDFIGNVSISAGTLSISSDANLGASTNDVALGGTLTTTSSISLASGRDISGSGSLNIAPGTILTTNGSFAVGALTLSNSGSLALSGSTNTLTSLTLNAAASISGNPITSSGAVTTGGFGGTATVSNNVSLGSSAVTYTVASGDNVVMSGNLTSTGSGRIQKRGSGTLTLSGDNSGMIGVQLGSQGASPLEGGTLVAGSNTALGGNSTTSFQFNAGTLTSSSSRVFATGLSIGGRSGTGVSIPTLSGSAMEFQGAPSFFRATGTSGSLNLNVNNQTTLSGNFAASIGGGTASGITLGGSGLLTLTGNNALLTDPLSFTDTLTVHVNAATSGLGTGSVTVGSGTTLKVTDATLANAIGVSGTLTGNGGLFSGSVTINAGGLLSPGNSPGLITNSGTLVFQSSSIYAWELANFTTSGPGTNFDQIVNTGTLTVNAGATLSPLFTGLTTAPGSGNSFWDSTHSWVVVSNSGALSGVGFVVDNSSWSGVGSFSTSLQSDSVVLTWTAASAVPEPSTYAALAGALVLGFAVWRKRQRARLAH